MNPNRQSPHNSFQPHEQLTNFSIGSKSSTTDGNIDCNFDQCFFTPSPRLTNGAHETEEDDVLQLKPFFPIDLEHQKTKTVDEQAVPNQLDVICGRSSTAFNNVGNRKFRIHISRNLQKYARAKRRLDKSRAIISTINSFRLETGARFLKVRGGKYVELTEKEIRSKVGHALRDMVVQRASGSKGKLQVSNVKSAIRELSKQRTQKTAS